jgi:hypothetical protein
MIEINGHEIVITRAVFDSDRFAEELEGYYKDCKEMKLTEDDILYISDNYTDEEIFKEYYKGDIPVEIKYKKPPLGLMPKRIHDESRLDEISEAIKRYIAEKKEIPIEWIEEYRSLLSKEHIPNIKEYAEMIGKKLEIYHTEPSISYEGREIKLDGSFSVIFRWCEIKNGSILRKEYGEGFTEKDALNDYTKKIIGKTLVFNATSKDREEYYVKDLSLIE